MPLTQRSFDFIRNGILKPKLIITKKERFGSAYYFLNKFVLQTNIMHSHEKITTSYGLRI
jgi:hypothetical protein